MYFNFRMLFCRFEVTSAEYRLWKFLGKWTESSDRVCNRWQIEGKACCWISALAQSVCRANVNIFRLYHVRSLFPLIIVDKVKCNVFWKFHCAYLWYIFCFCGVLYFENNMYNKEFQLLQIYVSSMQCLCTWFNMFLAFFLGKLFSFS